MYKSSLIHIRGSTNSGRALRKPIEEGSLAPFDHESITYEYRNERY